MPRRIGAWQPRGLRHRGEHRGELFAEKGEVAEAAGMDQVEAGLVAEEEVEFGVRGGVCEGGDEAIELGRGGVGFHLGIEGAHFDGAGAAGPPIGGNHFFDDGELDCVDGLKTGHVGIVDFAKGIGIFVAEQQALGENAVFEGVLGRPGFALGSFGTAGQGAVGAIRGETFFRDDHGIFTPPIPIIGRRHQMKVG